MHVAAQIKKARLGHDVLALLVALHGLGMHAETFKKDMCWGGGSGFGVQPRGTAGSTQTCRAGANNGDAIAICRHQRIRLALIAPPQDQLL